MAGLRIGWTATRKGISDRQESRLSAILTKLPWGGVEIAEFHHGDCVGGDTDGHNIAYHLGIGIWLHPPIKPDLRAYNEVGVIGSCAPADYLTRDRCIVESTELLIAGISGNGKSQKGGTWYTANYASGMGKPRIMLYTNGDMEFSRQAMALYGDLFDHAEG